AAPVAVPSAAPAAEPSVVPRAVAAQVAPVVVSIAQRPAGTHQLTLTVNPDSLGPVTVRARIGHNGDIQVQLSGATDAGREALRTIVAELRRDLAAVTPHATLTLGSGSGAEAGASDRGTQPGAGGGAGERTPQGGNASSRHTDHRPPSERAGGVESPVSRPLTPAAGAGLDIFA
ncbi:flagellar hook-length control protein FliK, partial [Microbacterium sp. 179-I 3D4 NHS]|uniref:flagellar hook-length control protein FliK n=1 Tax=Microbacterium sp. 179-I 3D4 NHS TaxID=3142381 RepID=UPI0039A3449D